MAKIKKSDLKAMDEKTANEKIKELKAELMKLNAQVAIGTNIENAGRIKAIKKTIARLLTIISSKKKAFNKGGVTKK